MGASAETTPHHTTPHNTMAQQHPPHPYYATNFYHPSRGFHSLPDAIRHCRIKQRAPRQRGARQWVVVTPQGVIVHDPSKQTDPPEAVDTTGGYAYDPSDTPDESEMNHAYRG